MQAKFTAVEAADSTRGMGPKVNKPRGDFRFFPDVLLLSSRPDDGHRVAIPGITLMQREDRNHFTFSDASL